MAESGTPLRVIVSGMGRMGREVMAGLAGQTDVRIVGVVDRAVTSETLSLPDGSSVPAGHDLAALLARAPADVLIDFTHHDWTERVAPVAVEAGVRPVIGTTGLSDAFIARLGKLCDEHGIGGVVAANFALGAVLLMHLCRIAAPFFEYAEIIEQHHEGKVDAPSGTALATARAMVAARGRPFAHPEPTTQTLPGTRGGAEGGVGIHSVRLQGLVAHQEVIFGALGQTLTLRHDTTSRASFIPGVALAARAVMQRRGLVIGLEPLLGLT